MNQNELCHYGIVGMRWGHRKNGYYEGKSHRKVKTWSGRTTTTGKQFVDSLLTVGILGTVKDIQYYRNNK